jgi:hypothetical protein
MTIIGVGKPMPSQLFLMQMAGFVIEGRMKVNDPSDLDIERSRQDGYLKLREMTGQDYGCDVARWYEFLIIGDYELTHPYGYETLRQFLEGAGYATPSRDEAIAKLKARQES